MPIFKKIHLEPGNRLFSELMSNGQKYRVPRFQRDYAWDSENWDELWQDIEEVRESRVQHFMGYVVFQEGSNKAFEIIDGQQRITTLLILVIAALNKLQNLIDQQIEETENKTRIETYQKNLVGVFNVATLTVEPKLILNRHNNDHFSRLVQNSGIVEKRNLIQTNRKINKAFQFFQKKFAEIKSGREVAEIIADIGDGLLFTTIKVDNDLDAYTVFETLNARGLHLSTPDLLKNYLLSMLASDPKYGEDHFLDFEAQWADILEQLGETKFTAFLRTHSGMRNKLSYKKDLFKNLKKEVNEPNKILPYLRDLGTYSPIYAALQDHNDNFWKEGEGKYSAVREHLECLNIFSIKTPLSLLMAGYHELPHADFLSLLRHITTMSIRYNVICNYFPNVQEQTYNQIANKIMAGEKSLNKLIAMLSNLYPDDDDFARKFEIKTIPSRQSSKKILFLLRKIEQQLGGKEPPTSLTLEHVLPYSPDQSWQEYFGEGAVEQGIDRLGNMALLDQNQNMGQESFAQKRKVLRNSNGHINKHIAECAEWNMDNLHDHQRWLAQQAKTVWKISQLDK